MKPGICGSKRRSKLLYLNTLFSQVADCATGDALRTSEVGELVIRGPQVMAGYLNDTKLSMEVLDDDGWYHTGDLVYRTKSGQFHFVDRKSEMIVSGSNQVGY